MRLATVRLGAPGGRPALMAHCFLGHAGAWKGLAAALADPPDALAFDLPGHGRSPMPAAPGDLLAEVAGQVPGLIGGFAPGRPVLGFGHSFGGAVLLHHALAAPETVAGLVLVEPVVFAAARDRPEWDGWLADEAPVHAALAAGDPARAARIFVARNGDGTAWAAIPEAERARLVRLIPLLSATAPGVVADSGGMLAPGRPEGFERPVLLVTGTASPPIFRAVCAALAERLPRAEVAQVAGAGHMLPVTHARAVAALVDDWRARHGL